MSDCPYCRQPGAVRLFWKVRCPNAACPKYDSRMSAGTLARTTGPRAGVLGKTGPVAGGADNARVSPFSWGRLFGGLMLVTGLASIMGVFKPYIQSRGFMWGLALIYLGWKTIQGSKGPEPEAGEAGGEPEGEDGQVSGNPGELEEDLEGQSADSRFPFDATGENRLEIHYVDFEGTRTAYVADRRTIRGHEKRISACVAPDGKRVILDSDRIINFPEVDAAIRDAGMN